MMTVHSNITNIEQAIQSCQNNITIVGVLSELGVDIIHKGDDNILIKYKGVVDVNSAFIKIYGSVHNNSPLFRPIANTLNELDAEVTTVMNDGEIIETKYNNQASMVYLTGALLNNDSINVSYIKVIESDVVPYIVGDIVGLLQGVDEENRALNVFIFDGYYHKELKLTYHNTLFTNDLQTNHMVKIKLDTFSYQSQYPPIQCIYCHNIDSTIESQVSEQAINEHNIFMESLK